MRTFLKIIPIFVCLANNHCTNNCHRYIIAFQRFKKKSRKKNGMRTTCSTKKNNWSNDVLALKKESNIRSILTWHIDIQKEK